MRLWLACQVEPLEGFGAWTLSLLDLIITTCRVGLFLLALSRCLHLILWSLGTVVGYGNELGSYGVWLLFAICFNPHVCELGSVFYFEQSVNEQ